MRLGVSDEDRMIVRITSARSQAVQRQVHRRARRRGGSVSGRDAVHRGGCGAAVGGGGWR